MLIRHHPPDCMVLAAQSITGSSASTARAWLTQGIPSDLLLTVIKEVPKPESPMASHFFSRDAGSSGLKAMEILGDLREMAELGFGGS